MPDDALDTAAADADSDTLRPLRVGRYFTEAEIAEHARRAVAKALHRRDYPTQGAIAAALGVSGPALSAALAYGDDSRQPYPRGKSVRRAVVRLLLRLDFAGEPSFAAVEGPPEDSARSGS
jgi:hypothetical protein